MSRHARFLSLTSPSLRFAQICLSHFSAAAIPPQWRRRNFSASPDILPFCAAAKSLSQTKQSHALAILHGRLPDSISISAALILSYASFNSHPSVLRKLFAQTLPFSRSAFLHNTLIRAHTMLSSGYRDISGIAGFLVYNDMLRRDVRPDDHTFPFVLKVCSDFVQISKGLEVHGTVIKSGLDHDVFVNNTLILFYGSFGDLGSLDKVFDEMPEKDIISWNTIIRVYEDNGCALESISLFKDMISLSRFRPNTVTVVSVLPVCAEVKDEEMVGCIHCYLVKVGLDSQLCVSNSLVDAYGKCGDVETSKEVFHEMVERNEVSWNAIIGIQAQKGYNRDALDSFRLMINESLKPSSITIATLLPVLIELRYFNEGLELHGFSVRMGLDFDEFVVNALMDMYAKWGQPMKASSLFDKMNMRNIVSWNTMVANFAQNRCELQAIELVREMQAHNETPNALTLINVLPACARLGTLRLGKEIHARTIRTGLASDIFISNALTDTYAKCGCLNLAQNLFDISLRDEVSYNSLIVGYSQTSECLKSVGLFTEMEMVGMKHDSVSFMGVLTACANSSAVKRGKEIHAFATRRFLHEHLFVANSLLNLYIKCGKIHTARKVFDRIPSRDTASWNAMILGFGMLGELDTAINLFESMREDGIEYDSVSYIAILSACSHAGLVENGKEYFDDMLSRNIKPSQMHYACMVDLLGRSGLMEEAIKLINGLPFKPDINIWGAFLGACRVHGNADLGCLAAEHLLELKPEHSGYYTLLSNMYAEAGRWEEADRVRKLMIKRKVKKNPGRSWVQLQDRVDAFIVGERFRILEPYFVAS